MKHRGLIKSQCIYNVLWGCKSRSQIYNDSRQSITIMITVMTDGERLHAKEDDNIVKHGLC